MIGYVTLGTNDIERASAFYDELLAEVGAKRILQTETFIACHLLKAADMIGGRLVRQAQLSRCG